MNKCRPAPQKILISACLLGRNVRYDGGHCFVEARILETWAQQNRLVPLCPEMAGGLPTPRPPAEIAGGLADEVWRGHSGVFTKLGHNVTSHFLAGAQAALTLAQENKVRMAILKEKSPSCGLVNTYDGQFQSKLVPGPGVTSSLLIKHGIRVFSEQQLDLAAAYLASLEQENPH